MPKVIELTIEIEIQRVTCPGVWLCQDGRVSLTVFALGTSYQTCLLPPVFPLCFRDVFYFRKRYQESCAVNNICCLLQDETIYCELVQWCDDCSSSECVILAQYLGCMNDVLFPPNMCSSDGVDLLMRRAKEFPGILSPKIEIATKVRIDEVWHHYCKKFDVSKIKKCHCSPNFACDGSRQKQVCHSAQYHRKKCSKSRHASRSRSRSRSDGSRSCCSLEQKDDVHSSCCYPNPISKSRVSLSPCPTRPCRDYHVYSMQTRPASWQGVADVPDHYGDDDDRINESDKMNSSMLDDDRLQKLLLESRYIDQDYYNTICGSQSHRKYSKKMTPCVCEICRRYHELFHTDDKDE